MKGFNPYQYTHPPGIFVAAHYKMDDQYSCYRPDGTKDWLIMYTLKGKGIVELKQELIALTPGDICIIPPGTPQIYYTDEGHHWEKLWAHFFPRPHWMEWIEIPRHANPLIHKHIENRTTRHNIESAFRRLIAYNQECTAKYPEELFLNGIEEILLLMTEHTSNEKLDPRIREILNVLSQQYTETHQLTELARRVCLSPSRLAHLFKSQVGESIMETLMVLRLKQAEKRLVFTNRSITEIAFETGFNTPDYFTRQFAKYYGTTPSKFRKDRQHSQN